MPGNLDQLLERRRDQLLHGLDAGRDQLLGGRLAELELLDLDAARALHAPGASSPRSSRSGRSSSRSAAPRGARSGRPCRSPATAGRRPRPRSCASRPRARARPSPGPATARATRTPSGSCDHGTMSMRSPPSSRTMLCTREPLSPTHEPTASTRGSVEYTEILEREPASRATALISTMLSAISGTSLSNSRRRKSGCVRDRITCGPLATCPR